MVLRQDEMGDDVPETAVLQPLLADSAARHDHLCPRQVLGVRVALCGLRALGLVGDDYRPRFHNDNKRLLTIVETDGCGADGIMVTADCQVGRRTLRVHDFGKMAATFVDTRAGRALRVWPHPQSRQLAPRYAPTAVSRWHAYLEAYRLIPDHELLRVQEVALLRPIAAIISRPDARVVCAQCGEEIMNEREIVDRGRVLCRACAGQSYYRPVADA